MPAHRCGPSWAGRRYESSSLLSVTACWPPARARRAYDSTRACFPGAMNRRQTILPPRQATSRMFCDRPSYCAPFRQTLEVHLSLEGESADELDEPGCSGCRVCDTPEVGARRVDIRAGERRPIHEVEDIDPEVERLATGQPHRSHEVHVHLQEVRPSDAIDSEREDALLEVGRYLCRIAFEPGVDVEPAIERRVVDGDVVEIAVEKQVAPREERSGLIFERAADLPAAEDRGNNAGVPERPARADRNLGQAAGSDAVRAAVGVRLPQRRLA